MPKYKVSRRYLIGFITGAGAYHYIKHAAFARNINTLNSENKLFAGASDITDGEIGMLLPEYADSGYSVPLSLVDGVNSSDPVQALRVLAPENPETRILSVEFGSMATGKFSTRIRLARSQTVTGLVRTRAGKIVSQQKSIVVVVGGCGNDLPSQE